MVSERSPGELRSQHNLPPCLTSFIGRGAEVTEVRGLLARHRLVTVAGPGGSGKTRLAVEAARELVPRFTSGVWLVELAQVDDPILVPAAVARVMAVHDQPGMPPAQSLAAAIGGRHALLVLDNCEHVIDAVADLCRTLLAAGDDLRILATSRVPLQEFGEARYPLAPLGVRNATGTQPDHDAVTLFIDRARAINPRIDLNPTSVALVGEIVRRLDGLPLAIELAAAQIDAISLTQMAASLLDHRFDTFTNPQRGAPERHSSLETTVEWSYRLLDDAEKRAFRRLSVFPAPFTREAATAVIGPDGPELVTRLVRNSLLVTPGTDTDGGVRDRMLETLRAFGLARLDEHEEREESAATMAEWIIHEAEQAVEWAAGPDDRRAAEWGDAEHDNAVESLEWFLGRDPCKALRIALALGVWAFLRGHYWEGQSFLERALDRVGDGPTELIACGQRWLGRLAYRTSGPHVGLEHVTSSVDLAVALGPCGLLIDSMNDQTVIQLNLGELAQGFATAEAALQMARDIGYPAGISYAFHNLALWALYEGNFVSALEFADQACDVDPTQVSGHIARWNVSALAGALVQNGDLDRAERICNESLDQWHRSDDVAWTAHQLETLARIEIRNGKAEEARRHLDEAVATSARIGFWLKLADTIATVAVWVGDRSPEMSATLWAAGLVVASGEALHRLPLSEITDRSDVMSAEDAAFYTAPMLEVRGRLGLARCRELDETAAALSIDEVVELAHTALNQPSAGHGAPDGLGRPLTKRERELVALVAEGFTDHEIAQKLFISIRTVRSHLDRIGEKTGARRRTELTRLAVRYGIIDTDN